MPAGGGHVEAPKVIEGLAGEEGEFVWVGFCFFVLLFNGFNLLLIFLER